MNDPVLQEPRGRRLVRQAARQVAWIRRRGLRQWAEEARLDVGERVTIAAAKWRWRRRHSVAPNAVPVWLVGVQRSGTTMFARRLGALAAVELHNETSSKAFLRFQLLPDETLSRLVMNSGHAVVVFKALCDSQRAGELLDGLATPSPGRAIWLYRSCDDRARSSLAKFGPHDLSVLREIAEGHAGDRWHARGLSEESLAFIRSLDWAHVSPETASAVFWYVRNRLFFEQGLDRRDDVLAVSYDRLLANPETVMRRVCAFLRLDYAPQLAANIAPRSDSRMPLEIDRGVRARCDELALELDVVAQKDF